MGKQKADSLTESEEKNQSSNKAASALAGAAVVVDGIETGRRSPHDADDPEAGSEESEAPLPDVERLLELIEERARARERAEKAARNIERNDWRWNSQYGDLLPEIVSGLDRFSSVRLIIFMEGQEAPRVLGGDGASRSSDIVLFRSGRRNREHYFRNTPDDTPGDGNCFYHAFLHAFHGAPPTFDQILGLKNDVAAYIRSHRDEVGNFLYEETSRSGRNDRTKVEDIGDETVYPQPNVDAEELRFDGYVPSSGQTGEPHTDAGDARPLPDQAGKSVKGILKSPTISFLQPRQKTPSKVFVRLPAQQRNNIRLEMLKSESRKTQGKINAASDKDEKSAYEFHLEKISGEYISLAIRKALSDARYYRNYYRSCLADLLAARQALEEGKSLDEVRQHALSLRISLAQEKKTRSTEYIASEFSHLVASRERLRFLRDQYGAWHETSPGRLEWVPDIPQQRIDRLNEEFAVLSTLMPDYTFEHRRFEAGDSGSPREISKGEYEDVPDLALDEAKAILTPLITKHEELLARWEEQLFDAQLAFENDCNNKASHSGLRLLLATAAQLMSQEKIIRPGGDSGILTLLNEASTWHKSLKMPYDKDFMSPLSPEERAELRRHHEAFKACNDVGEPAANETLAGMAETIKAGEPDLVQPAAEPARNAAADAVRAINGFHAEGAEHDNASDSVSLFSARSPDTAETSARSLGRKKIEMQPMRSAIGGGTAGILLLANHLNAQAAPRMEGNQNAAQAEVTAPAQDVQAREPLLNDLEAGPLRAPPAFAGAAAHGRGRDRARHTRSTWFAVIFTLVAAAAAVMWFARFLYGRIGESSSKKDPQTNADGTDDITTESVDASPVTIVSTTGNTTSSGDAETAGRTTMSSSDGLQNKHDFNDMMFGDRPVVDDHDEIVPVDTSTEEGRIDQFVRRRLLHEHRVKKLSAAPASQWAVLENTEDNDDELWGVTRPTYYFSRGDNKIFFITKKPYYSTVFLFMWSKWLEGEVDLRDMDFYELQQNGCTVRLHAVQGTEFVTIRITISKEGESDSTIVLEADPDSAARIIDNFNFSEKHREAISKKMASEKDWETYRQSRKIEIVPEHEDDKTEPDNHETEVDNKVPNGGALPDKPVEAPKNDPDNTETDSQQETIVRRRVLHAYRARRLHNASPRHWGIVESSDDETDGTITYVLGERFSFKNSPYQLLFIRKKPTAKEIFIDAYGPTSDESVETGVPIVDFSGVLDDPECHIEYIKPKVEHTGTNEKLRISKAGEEDSYLIFNGSAENVDSIIDGFLFQNTHRQDLHAEMQGETAQNYLLTLEGQVENILLSETTGNEITLDKDNQVFHIDKIPGTHRFVIHTPALKGVPFERRDTKCTYLLNEGYTASEDTGQIDDSLICKMSVTFKKAGAKNILLMFPEINCNLASHIMKGIVADEQQIQDRKKQEREEEDRRVIAERRSRREKIARETRAINQKLAVENVSNAKAPVIVETPKDVPVSVEVPAYENLPPQKIVIQLNHQDSSVRFDASTKGFFEIVMSALIAADPKQEIYDHRIIHVKNIHSQGNFQSSLKPSRNTADPNSSKFFSAETTDFHLDVRNEAVGSGPKNFGNIDAQIREMEDAAFKSYQEDESLFADESFTTNKNINMTYVLQSYKRPLSVNSVGENDGFFVTKMKKNATISITDGFDNHRNRKIEEGLGVSLVAVPGRDWDETDSEKYYVRKFRNQFSDAFLVVRSGDVNMMKADERQNAMAAVDSFSDKVKSFESKKKALLTALTEWLAFRTGVTLTNQEIEKGNFIWSGVPAWAKKMALRYHGHHRSTETAVKTTASGKEYTNFKVVRDALILLSTPFPLDNREKTNWAAFPNRTPDRKTTLFRLDIYPKTRSKLWQHNDRSYLKAMSIEEARKYRLKIQGGDSIGNFGPGGAMPDDFFGAAAVIEAAIENWANMAQAERVKWRTVTDHMEDVADRLDAAYRDDALAIKMLLRRMNGKFTGFLMTASYPVKYIQSIPQVSIRNAFYHEYSQSMDMIGDHAGRRRMINDILKLADGSTLDGDTNVKPNEPDGDTIVKPGEPDGDTNVKPDKPDGDTNVKPDKPDGDTNVKPDKPDGDTNVKPDKPDGDTNVKPGEPDGDTNVKPDKPVKEGDEQPRNLSDYELVQWTVGVSKAVGGGIVVGGILYATAKVRTALGEISRLLRVLGTGAGYLLIPTTGGAATLAASATVAASGTLNVAEAYGYSVTKEMFRTGLFIEITGCATLVVFLGKSTGEAVNKVFDDPKMATALDALAKGLAEAGVIASCAAGSAGMTAGSEFGFIHRRLSYEEFLSGTVRNAGLAGGGLTASSGATDIVKCLMGYCTPVTNATDTTVQPPPSARNERNVVPNFALGVVDPAWSTNHDEEDDLRRIPVMTLKLTVAKEEQKKAQKGWWQSIFDSFVKGASVMERTPPG